NDTDTRESVIIELADGFTDKVLPGKQLAVKGRTLAVPEIIDWHRFFPWQVQMERGQRKPACADDSNAHTHPPCMLTRDLPHRTLKGLSHLQVMLQRGQLLGGKRPQLHVGALRRLLLEQ